MNKRIASIAAGAAIVGSGLAGFGLTSALAQTDEGSTETPAAEAPADGAEAPESCGPGGHRGGPGLEAMAEAIGISEDELRTALEDGSTPAEVAEENGVDRETLIDAVVASMEEHLAQGVEDGRLTQEEADEKLAEIEDRANDIVDGVRPEGGPMGHGGPGAPDGAEDDSADESDDSTTESTDDAEATPSGYAA